jgi:DNA helicase-2/ATP-dependent DNA helicase PcrA
MSTDAAASNATFDDHVEGEIAACLSLQKPRSFFLFAGAGSGKTRSLERALACIREQHSAELRLGGRGVAVITYTNAACDEIKRRVSEDPLFHVSTIHSFAWHLIGGFNLDIKAWLRVRLASDIREIEEAERKGRPGTQASATRQADMVAKTERLALLDQIKSFIYNPNGDNRETNSLNHAEVMSICADFLIEKPMMRRILVTKYPFLLVDESQDTNKQLVDALLAVEAAHRAHFCLGFFGDTMQRIYGDGKENFEEAIPHGWEKPRKELNHRCPKRIVALINQIRRDVDDQVQQARTDGIEGCVRLFILPSDTADKPAAEEAVRSKMAGIAKDSDWEVRRTCKVLILEHHMAARRMGFEHVFDPLYEISEFRTGLLDGTLPALRLFSESVLPLVTAYRDADKFRLAKIVRERSPLLSVAALAESKSAQAQLALVREALGGLMSLWQHGEPTCGQLLNNIANTGLFGIPDSLKPFLSIPGARQVARQNDASNLSKPFLALMTFLEASFSEIEQYVSYLDEHSSFDTHQGIKGLEFDRVMVVMDDTDARGFLFSYDKLFGAKQRTAADIKNEREGRETGLDRTRRLFYVTCSRAKRSLALVAYTDNPGAVRSHVLQNGWFEQHEVV